MKKMIRLFTTGFTMGAADIVPGVSGGTVAFLLGIYEELIQSIKLLSGKVPKLLLQGQIKEAWRTIPFGFLVPLVSGLMTALFTLSNLISYLIKAYPQFLWAFFFGLVLASGVVVSKRVVTWNAHDYLACALTAVLAYLFVGAVPVETPNTLLALFLSGAIAICAMILPGISGSFLLVILGKYEQILTAVSNRELLPIFVFGMGTVVGLALFSRVLSWLFRKHHDVVIAMLVGFMFGSLRKVWPWKEVVSTRVDSHGDVVPLIERNIIPDQVNTEVLICLGLFLLGLIVVGLLDRLDVTREHVQDLDDNTFAEEHQQAVESQVSGKL